MRSQLRLRVLLPTAVLALAGVGVGAFAFGGTPPLAGDDQLPTPPPKHAAKAPAKKKQAAPVATKKTWATEANRLCAAALKESEALETPETREALQANLQKGLQILTKLLADVEALPRPAGERRDVGRFLALARQSNAVLTRAVEATSANDLEGFADAMDEGDVIGDKFDRVAVRLGAGDCAVDSTKPLTPLEKALERNRIVVAVVYASDGVLDRLTIREARAGANAARAGFVAVKVAESKDLRTLAKETSIRKPPAILVMRRWVGAVTTFPGYADRVTVAQAAENART